MSGKHQFTFFAAAVMAMGAFGSSLRGQAQPAPMQTHALTGGVYWIEGGVGSNSGVVVGKDGVIVIDAKQTPGSGRDVVAEVAKLTAKPITHIILTHSNLDHVDGLAGFPKGLTIIAQENCKEQMEHAAANPQNIDLRDYIPTKAVAKKESMVIDGVHFVLWHFAPAHTSGDLIIISAGTEDGVHGRHYRHAASISAHSSRRPGVIGGMDRKHEGNRGAQCRYFRAWARRDAVET
jgi:hypothetical protein